MSPVLENGKQNEYRILLVEPPELLPEYVELRDRTWEKKVQDGVSVGKEFTNGVIYRFLGIENDQIKLTTMMYSDRMFKKAMSPSEIVSQFGESHLMIHGLTNIIMVTTDGYIAVGIKKMSTYLEKGKLAHVSGNLNKDEVEINTFEDIYRMAMLEVQQETSLNPVRDRIHFANVSKFSTCVSFNFIYLLDIPSKEVETLNRDGEFVSFEAMSTDDILKTNRSGITDFEESKNWIKEAVFETLGKVKK